MLDIYHTAIKPMELAYKYNELRQHEVTGKVIDSTTSTHINIIVEAYKHQSHIIVLIAMTTLRISSRK